MQIILPILAHLLNDFSSDNLNNFSYVFADKIKIKQEIISYLQITLYDTATPIYNKQLTITFRRTTNFAEWRVNWWATPGSFSPTCGGQYIFFTKLFSAFLLSTFQKTEIIKLPLK